MQWSHWLSTRAMIQYLLTTLPLLHTPNLWLLFKCVGKQEGLLKYYKKAKLSKEWSDHLFSWSEDFRIALVSPKSRSDGSSVTGVRPYTPYSKMHEIYFIDNIRIDKVDDEAQVIFYLPRTHGLDPANVDVYLWARQAQAAFPIYPLSIMEEKTRSKIMIQMGSKHLSRV